MHFHNQTVFKSVSSLNQDYFLPALQREFVWDQGQVLRLFDSLLQGYPIGSFLFWEPPSSSTGGQTYAFVYEARARVHNPPAPVSARRPVLVLDGQQRLTSLLIGLRGSLADKPKFTRKHLERNWTKRFLHLDLFTGLSFKTEDDVDGAVGDLHYRLRFWSETPAASTTSCWFKVSEIYSRKNPRSLRTLIRTMVRRLPRKCKARHHRAVETNLRRLHEVVFHDKSISYHLEDGSDADRVLNIFVRANEGGTELSRADLLMSTVTQRWDKLDAREEIRGLVDDLNNDISDDGRGPFSTDFVLKACFVLEEMPIKFRLSNFRTENLHKIETNWSDLSAALRNGVHLARFLGFNRRNLTSVNALIPVMFYLRTHPSFTIRGTSEFDVRNRRSLHRFLLTAMLFRVFRQSSDSLLRKIREVLAKYTKEDRDFPLEELMRVLRESRYLPDLARSKFEEIIGLTYDKPESFLALSLFYDEPEWVRTDDHKDHIFAASTFAYDQLSETGLDDDEIEWCLAHYNDLPNLALLLPRENQSKSDSAAEEWLRRRSRKFQKQHLLPTAKHLYRLRKFHSFYEKRRILLLRRLRQLFAD